jgi:hypothetical protein
MSSSNMLSEYKFVDLYNNNDCVGNVSFMISGDKYIQTYRLGDPPIRTGDNFVCKLWGFRESNNVKTLTFIDRESERLIDVNINIDGKVFTSGFVKGYFLNIDMPDQFSIFQQY